MITGFMIFSEGVFTFLGWCVLEFIILENVVIVYQETGIFNT